MIILRQLLFSQNHNQILPGRRMLLQLVIIKLPLIQLINMAQLLVLIGCLAEQELKHMIQLT